MRKAGGFLTFCLVLSSVNARAAKIVDIMGREIKPIQKLLYNKGFNTNHLRLDALLNIERMSPDIDPRAKPPLIFPFGRDILEEKAYDVVNQARGGEAVLLNYEQTAILSPIKLKGMTAKESPEKNTVAIVDIQTGYSQSIRFSHKEAPKLVVNLGNLLLNIHANNERNDLYTFWQLQNIFTAPSPNQTKLVYASGEVPYEEFRDRLVGFMGAEPENDRLPRALHMHQQLIAEKLLVSEQDMSEIYFMVHHHGVKPGSSAYFYDVIIDSRLGSISRKLHGTSENPRGTNYRIQLKKDDVFYFELLPISPNEEVAVP